MKTRSRQAPIIKALTNKTGFDKHSLINSWSMSSSSLIVLGSIFTLMFGGLTQSSSQSSRRSSPTRSTSKVAKSILQKSGARYATVSSYQDSGVVEVTPKDAQKSITRIQFDTYFVRPDLLSFEWIEQSNSDATRNIVWLNGKEISTYQAPNVLKRGEPSGLVAATVQSEGAAQSIPRLLTGVGGFALTDLDELTLQQEGQFEGRSCYVIKGKHQVPTTTYAPYPKVQSTGKEELASIELWIDKSNYVILKIRTTITFDSTVIEESHRAIKLNASIPDEIFKPKYQ